MTLHWIPSPNKQAASGDYDLYDDDQPYYIHGIVPRMDMDDDWYNIITLQTLQGHCYIFIPTEADMIPVKRSERAWILEHPEEWLMSILL